MILVTGGCGYIGAHFVLACRDAGRPVIVLDDLSSGHRDAIDPSVPFYGGDVADPALLARITGEHRVTAVVHFAARISVTESMTDPDLYVLENEMKTARLAALCRAHGIPDVILSSTAAVYGADTPRASETSATIPLSPYGASKLAAERAVRDTQGLRHVILRYFNVAGADPMGRIGQRNADAAHLIARLCAVATGRRAELHVFGTDFDTRDGSAIRDFIHVSDIARAHLCALDHLQRGGPSVTLNCGSERGVSVLEAVAAMEALLGRPIPTVRRPRRDGDIAEIVADARRIRDVLGFAPRYGLREICADTLAFAQALAQLERDNEMPMLPDIGRDRGAMTRGRRSA
ncbi:UDP-glucose 4-epimerase GalE [uncultured Jannaschia sp.]|uniref:UDP-glucose 4-epimerase GalE n=1 Tax=uncultured Jannaschia sp. TaxID=293347 RepID=UPI0026100809|nr:UDP-glucose 4-epimerase GalE [uncultured Jannaschia sp.]